MRILEFDVDKQRLQKNKTCDFNNIVAGTARYLHAKFNFSEKEWAGCKKAVSFYGFSYEKNYETNEIAVLLDENNMCEIPKEVLTDAIFVIKVTGQRPDGYVITTNLIKINQEVK